LEYQSALARDHRNAAALKERRDIDTILQDKERAKVALEAGKGAIALSVIDRLLQRSPGSDELKLLRIDALVTAGKYEEAYADSGRLLTRFSQHPRLLFARAKALYYQDNFDAAMKHLKAALQADPDNSECAKYLKMLRKLSDAKQKGNAAFKEEKWAEAIAAYSEALELDPANKAFNAKLLANRGAAYMKLRKYADAVADCSSALEIDDDYTKARQRRAVCLKQLGGLENLEKAMYDYEALKRSASDHATMRNYQREIHDLKGLIKKAKRKDYYKILG
ncbi:dnajc7, partial [Symbiodinium sp. KB8]